MNKKEEFLFYLHNKYPLQTHVGGRTSLVIQGYGHYAELGERKNFLFSTNNFNPPLYLKKYIDKYFLYKNISYVFDKLNLTIFLNKKFVDDKKFFYISCPELAIFEMLYFVPEYVGFDESFKIVENCIDLDCFVMQSLLESCKDEKLKRLTCFFSLHSNHEWYKNLNLKKINFDNNIIKIIDNGVLENEFMITVPENYLFHEDKECLF